MNSPCLKAGVAWLEVHIVENFKSSRDASGWQPSQNLAFWIIAGGIILGGVLVFLL